MSVCKDCHSYAQFKEKCWYFWENKRACSQFRANAAAEPNFISIEQIERALEKA